jgi:hypothetical protein
MPVSSRSKTGSVPASLIAMIGGDGDDMLILRRQRFAVGGFQATRLDLRDRLALVSLDQHQVAGRDAGDDFLECQARVRRATRA